MKQFLTIAFFQDHGQKWLWSEITSDRMHNIHIPEVFRVPAGIDWRELASVSTGNVSEFAFFCRSKQGSRNKSYCKLSIAEAMVNQRTNGPVNAHLISWPSKAQNIQNLKKHMVKK